MKSILAAKNPAEKSENKQKPSLALKTSKIEGMLVKSRILEGFWAAGLKPRKVSKTRDWFQNRTKLMECYKNHMFMEGSGRPS